jgi:6-phosphogluconolactonase
MDADPTHGGAIVRVHRKEEYAARAADTIAEEIRTAVARRGACSLALAGGMTPRPVYAELARLPNVPWDAVEIYFGDERAVGPAHPRSNYAAARRYLLQRAPISDLRVHRMPGERPDLQAAARFYAELLPDSLDVLLLGVGVDGHVASIFPLSEAVEPGGERVRVVRAPVSRERRLTITTRVIREARTVIVLARGRTKAKAVQHALRSRLPVRRCPARAAAGATWIVDEEAARRLAIPIPATGRSS